MKNLDPNIPALIIGGGDNVNYDLKNLKNLIYPYEIEDFFHIIVVNDQIYNWQGRIDVIATLHGEKINEWFKQSGRKPTKEIKAFYHRPPKPDDEQNFFQKLERKEVKERWKGSSGLFAVQIAIDHLKKEKIILAGVPMDQRPNYFRDEEFWRKWYAYQKNWVTSFKVIKGKTKSLSGWTKEQLGFPTKEFIFN